MKLDRNKQYQRIDSYLIENGVQILKFLQEFSVNIDHFEENHFIYHEKYISDNPTQIEWLIEEEEQLEYYCDEFKSSQCVVEKEEKEVEVVEEVSQQDTDISSFNPTWSRKQQVKFYLNRGVEKVSEIAEKIGANPSYVQRLVKEIKSK